ncbi:MAG: hypothetical protein RLZZ28_2342 [Bacteroidota bacterium]|jgi:FKBP-type peptidyl-prolyl cis-trans isomerase
MKTLFLVTSLMLLTSFTVTAQTKTRSAAEISAAKNKAALDTVQYILGTQLIQQAISSGYPVNNPAMIKRGIDDVLQGKKLMVSANDAQLWLTKYQQLYAMEKGKELESLMFSQAKTVPGMIELPSGISYKILTQASGTIAQLNDTVVVNIIGKIPDGTVFQDSYKENASLIGVTKNFIPGLREILQKMPQGSVWRVLVPASLAYGATGNGINIPPYSPLVFDIALAEVRKSK